MGGAVTGGARTRSVVVVGTGIVGSAAAIALRRALPHATITLVDLPVESDGWIDRLGAASPVIHQFHRQIGFDPRVFVQRAHAEPVHLRQYRQHNRPGESAFREASTATIQFVEGVPLHQIWLRHHAAGAPPILDFAAMLLAIREAGGDAGGFGARYDAVAYRRVLKDMAATLKIVRYDTEEVRVVTDGTAVTGISINDGILLAADLYVDAAGPRSRLLAALGVDWHDWSPQVPAMELAIEPGGSGRFGEEVLDSTGDETTWQTRRWSAQIAASVGARRPGRLAHFWRANAVAIGEAAAHAPVSDGVRVGLAFEDILRLVSLLPRPDSVGRDIAEYDRRTKIACESLAEWSSLCLSPDDADRPAALRERIDAFAARGRVTLRELDPILPGQWLARLMARGPVPCRIDPTALALSETIVRATIARAAS